MAKTTELELAVSLKDNASGDIKKVAKETEKSAKKVAEAAKDSAKTQQEAAKQTDKVQEQLSRKAERYAQQLAQSRKMLGTRAEREIQHEIRRTEIAYQRLARSGKASSEELKRAYAAQKQQIAALNAEMKGLNATGAQFGSNFLSKAGTAIAAFQGIKGKLAPAMSDQKQWDQNVTDVALLAFNDKDANYIKTTGKQRINDAVRNVVANVGGSADQGLGVLNSMMANGMDFEQAEAILPMAQKMVIAGKANPEDIGNLLKVLSDYGFKGDELQMAFQHAMKSGTDGKFEIADMTKHLPNLLAVAGQAGFTGMKDFDYLLAMLQSTANQSGSNDTAANNVANLLNKVLAEDTAKRFEKIDNPDVKGKQIDWKGTVEEYRANGQNPVQALVDLADKMLKKDKGYQKLMKQLDKAETDEQKRQIHSQINLKKGLVLGKLMPDVQAKGGLNATADTKAMFNYLNGTNNPQLINGSIEKAVEVYNASFAAKEARYESLKMLDSQSLTKNLNEMEAKYHDYFTNLAQSNPDAARWLQSTKLGAEALGTAAGYGLGAKVLMNGMGSKVVSGATTMGGPTATAAGSSALLAPLAVGAIALTTPANLIQENDEDKKAELQRKVALGTATPTELAQADAMYAKTKQDVINQRTKRENYFKDRPAFTPEQQQEYDLALAPKLKAFEEKERIDKRDNTPTTYQAYGTVAKQEAGSLTAAYLSGYQKTHNTEKSAAYSGLSNENLGAPSLFKQNQLPPSESLINLDFSPLQQAQERSMSNLQTTLSADMNNLGQQISTGLKAAIQAQTSTIQNQITVLLDGRVVAEQSSEHQYQAFKRMG